MSNVVAIVGRPNVGKSTLFNRLIENRKAIVGDQSGITRDRHYGVVEWTGKSFMVIDTGGYVPESEDVFEAAIREQVHIALEEATALIFMVDNTCGITDLDQEFANILRQTNKPVYVAANKVDNSSQVFDVNEFYKFGIGNIFGISAMSGSGTGELLDELVNDMNFDENVKDQDLPRISILGKPNVGKSSLVNALLGEERNIVTDIPGTTRDSINSHYKAFGHDFILTDTAGLRKKTKVKENIEFYSNIRSIKALQECDVCLLMIDAVEGIGAQEANILHAIESTNKGIVIVVNKWDLVEKSTNTSKEYEKKILEKTAPFTDIPIVFISALNKTRILKAIEVAVKVYENRSRRITTSKLNDLLLKLINDKPPPSVGGKYIKIKYVTQLPTKTPAFAFFCNHPKDVKESYKRFIENNLRRNFDFSGVPLTIYFRKK